LTRSISISTGFDQYQQLASGDLLSFPGSVFYDPAFLKISADILGLEPEPVVSILDNAIVGLGNFLVKNRFGIRTMTIPKFFQYYGPVMFESSAEVMPALEKHISQNTDLAVFSIVPQNSESSIYRRWDLTERLTYYLKPDSLENLRKGCFEDVKNKLNKAAKSGIEIRVGEEFPYDIYRATFKRQGLKPPMPELELTRWVDQLIESGLAKTFIAYQSGRPLAFRTQLIAHKYAYDWLAGSFPDANPLGVNQFLIVNIGNELYKNGIGSWDLLGGDIKSIGEFKRSFGSVPQKHLQIELGFTLKGKIYRQLMKIRESSHD
jgi:hypothetical protein